MVSVTITQLCHYSTKVAIKQMSVTVLQKSFIQLDHVPQCANPCCQENLAHMHQEP